MNKNSIDIIVPVYNAEDTLDKCLTSLVKQNFSNFRVLLIDDGSTDSSSKICDEYSQKYENVITFHTKNNGRAAARNYGLAKANSEYVMFVDSDDWVETQFCYLPFKYIEQYDYDLVMFGYKINDNEIEKKVNLPINQEFQKISNQKAFQLLLNDEIGSFSWNKIFKRKLFLNIKYPVNHVFEDTATIYKVVNQANQIGILNEYLYHYQQRSNSVMHSLSTSTIWDSILARKQFHEFINKNYPELDNLSYSKLAFNYLQYAVYAYREHKYDCKLEIETKRFLKNVNMRNLKFNKKNLVMLYLFKNHILLFRIISKLTQ